jgi:hypothetical protein
MSWTPPAARITEPSADTDAVRDAITEHLMLELQGALRSREVEGRRHAAIHERHRRPAHPPPARHPGRDHGRALPVYRGAGTRAGTGVRQPDRRRLVDTPMSASLLETD